FGPADPGYGVRQRNGGEGLPGPAEDQRGADRPSPRRPRPAAPPAQLPRRLAAPPLPAADVPAVAVPDPLGPVAGRGGRLDGLADAGAAGPRPGGPRRPQHAARV